MKPKNTYVFAIAIAVFIFTLEISFTYSLWLNGYLFLFVSIYLLFKRKAQWLIWLFLLPLLPAVTTFWSVFIKGSGSTDAWVLFTRTYAFASLGIFWLTSVDLEECLLVLEQFNLSTTFVYGILVVIHATPAIKREVKAMYEAGLLRGKKLYPWSAYYYVKIIFLALSWRDSYTEAMYARGFTEQGERMHYQNWQVSKKGWFISFFFLLLGNCVMYLETI